MTDVIEDSHDGLFIIPGDAESLASAITRLCLDGELRQRLGSAAQEKMKRYTWSGSACRHEMVFNRAMGFNTDSGLVAKQRVPPQKTSESYLEPIHQSSSKPRERHDHL